MYCLQNTMVFINHNCLLFLNNRRLMKKTNKTQEITPEKLTELTCIAFFKTLNKRILYSTKNAIRVNFRNNKCRFIKRHECYCK